jgi:hypothetical protein
VRVPEFVGVKINDRDPDAMFDFEFTEVVQVPFPLAVLHQILGRAFGEKDVTSVADIHHALRHVNSRARDV